VSTEPTGGEAVSYSHSGDRFVLGWGTDFFGIWDRSVPGEPVARFPRTDAGWGEAWKEFTARERRYVDVRPGAAPMSAPSPAAYRSTAPLSKVLRFMIGAVAVLAVLTMAARVGLIARLQEFQRGAASRANIVEVGDAVDGLAVATFLLTLVTAVVWIVWQHHAHRNLPVLGVTGMRYDPVMVVLWWVIPVANFVMPLLTLNELWRASDPEARTSDWRSKPMPGLLIVWWIFFVSRIPLGWAAAVLQEQPQTAERLLSRAYLGLAVDATIVVAAVLAIAVVRHIQRRQHESAATLAPVAVTSTA
jgi:hypothetical protein